MDPIQGFIKQLDDVIRDYEYLRQGSKHDDLSDLPVFKAVQNLTRLRAVIHRVSGAKSEYVKQCEALLGEKHRSGLQASRLYGVAKALRSDVSAGYLQSVTELLHGELFADFLEMAQHLLDEGYKDAAAVIAGSSLEGHLRQICQKAGIDIELQKDDGSTSMKKAERLNSDLAKQEVYSKSDQKSVTAWLGLRNDAAHGDYHKYEAPQVGIMISGIRDFLMRNPA